MAVRPIRIYGDEVLRKKTRYVKTFDKKNEKLVADMFDTMYKANGIGLAAPQIGLLKKLFVIDTRDEGEKMALANVKIVSTSEETDGFTEGCLSIPGLEAEVVRPVAIRIQAQDALTGEPVERDVDGLLARVIQHENDHLNGVLFIDHLTDEQRKPLERPLLELASVVA